MPIYTGNGLGKKKNISIRNNLAVIQEDGIIIAHQNKYKAL